MAARFAVAWVGISLLVLFVAAMPASAADTATPVAFSGFVQARLNVQKDSPTTSFLEKRFYLTGTAVTGADTKVGFTFTEMDDPGVLMAYGEKAKGTDIYRIGAFRTPFGYEQGASAASLITLDRSVVVNTLVVPFDNGLFFDRVDGNNTISASVTNGRKAGDGGAVKNGDSNDEKEVTARFGQVKGKTVMGVSAQFDQEDKTKLVGFDYANTGKNMKLIGEALFQDQDGDTCGGFYVTAASLKAAKWQPYARLEWFDPNMDVSSNEFTGFTVGVSKAVNAMTKESLEISNGQWQSDTPTRSGSCSGQSWTGTFQYQAKF